MSPKVIFLDAVGTLFGVRGTVGDIYSQFAAKAGVVVDAVALNQAFIHSFQAAPKAAFPGSSPADLPQREFLWWQAIARQSFAQVGALTQIPDFGSFFQPLFDYFATAAPWFIYPEVADTLATWKQQGILLGVISNFDSRLYPVLEALKLAPFFDSVTHSTGVGVAKPELGIFAAALAHHGCSAHEAWHIGDSFADDYQGAVAAGLRGIWLDRGDASAQGAEADGVDRVATLAALLSNQ